MTDADIKIEIADAMLQRKQCNDRMSSYQRRLENARIALYRFTDKERNPRDEENQDIFSLKNDPREDAKCYLDALEEYDQLTDFLRKHNAL